MIIISKMVIIVIVHTYYQEAKKAEKPRNREVKKGRSRESAKPRSQEADKP